MNIICLLALGVLIFLAFEDERYKACSKYQYKMKKELPNKLLNH